LTFSTDINDLIRLGHGDVKRLRDIRDTIKHDNFITTIDKQYVESLISRYLKNQSLDEGGVDVSSITTVKSKDNVKSTLSEAATSSSSLFSGSNNKKLGILAGIAAAIALVVVVGFSASTMSVTDMTTSSEVKPSLSLGLTINVDESSYKEADIISVSGSVKSVNGKSVELYIENTSGEKIWKEYVNIKNDGKFSTLVIAGGYGWDSNGTYVLMVEYNDLENKTEFSFSV
tara:strand:+ start:610 stop:1299 length:690 start_codon:yes stop_codon:yes gene_type:complete